MNPIRFELRPSGNTRQPYYWRIVATANGKVLASSETYEHRNDVINAVNLVKTHAAGAEFLDYTKAA